MKKTWAFLTLLQLSQCSPHHGGLHAEHRMGRSESSAWPDSHSLWADIPTSQSFDSKVLQKWNPPESPSSSNFFSGDDSGLQSKRHAVPTADHFKRDHAEFEIEKPKFGEGFQDSFRSSQSADSFPHTSLTKNNGFNFKVQYEEERPKRHQTHHHFAADLPQGPPGARFSPPHHSSFPKSTEFNRPLRHVTSFPASYQQGHNAADHFSPSSETAADKEDDFKPSSLGSFGKSHSYTTFEAPKLNSNVFIDHGGDQEEFKRPSRSPVSAYRPEPPPRNFGSFSPPNSLKREPSRPEPPKYDTFDYGEYDTRPFQDYEPPQDSRSDEYPEESDSRGNNDYGIYDYSEPSPYYQDRGQIGDESYDRVNKEEKGNYEVRNYREPVRHIKYDRKDPIETKHYGNDYGGVETYRGGYDSEDDAKRGIVRYHPMQYAQKDIYVEDEPVEDYNKDGYYVPRERNAYEVVGEANESPMEDEEENNLPRGRPRPANRQQEPRPRYSSHKTRVRDDWA